MSKSVGKRAFTTPSAAFSTDVKDRNSAASFPSSTGIRASTRGSSPGAGAAAAAMPAAALAPRPWIANHWLCYHAECRSHLR
eukprot:4375748-Lingulodinium_polyedra.AAC.1